MKIEIRKQPVLRDIDPGTVISFATVPDLYFIVTSSRHNDKIGCLNTALGYLSYYNPDEPVIIYADATLTIKPCEPAETKQPAQYYLQTVEFSDGAHRYFVTEENLSVTDMSHIQKLFNKECLPESTSKYHGFVCDICKKAKELYGLTMIPAQYDSRFSAYDN